MKINRLVIVILTGLLLLVGCSTEAEKETNNKPQDVPAEGEESTVSEGFPITIEMNGQSVTLKEKPKKILPLSLDAAEVVLELVDPSQIVATTEGIDNPVLSTKTEKAAEIKNKIPSLAAINIDPEQIMSYDTDLLILTRTQGENEDAVKVLTKQNIPVLSFSPINSVDSFKKFIATIGEAVGEKDKAQALVNEIENTIKDIQATIPTDAKKPTVLILTEIYAGSGAYMGAGNIAHELIQLAGATPAVDIIGLERTTQASVEQVIKMDPDYIFFRDFQGKGEEAYMDLMNQPGWDTLQAVKNGHVKVIPTYITGSNTKLTEGLKTIVDTIYELGE